MQCDVCFPSRHFVEKTRSLEFLLLPPPSSWLDSTAVLCPLRLRLRLRRFHSRVSRGKSTNRAGTSASVSSSPSRAPLSASRSHRTATEIMPDANTVDQKPYDYRHSTPEEDRRRATEVWERVEREQRSSGSRGKEKREPKEGDEQEAAARVLQGQYRCAQRPLDPHSTLPPKPPNLDSPTFRRWSTQVARPQP